MPTPLEDMAAWLGISSVLLGWVLSLVFIGTLVLFASIISRGQPITIALMGILAFVVSIAFGWMPTYVLILVVIGAAILFVSGVKSSRGD